MKKSVLYPLYFTVLLSLLYFDKVLAFVMSCFSKLAAPIQCSGIVLCAIGTVLIIIIEIFRCNYHITQNTTKIVSNALPLFSDQPTVNDKYGRTTSAEVLIDKIFATYNSGQAVDGSFVVNINETYGSGKTSFLRIFEKQLCSIKQKYIFIDFRPWLCDNEQSIVNEFFSLLLNELPDTSIQDDISAYLKLLLSQVQDSAPSWGKALTAIISMNIKGKNLRDYHDSIKQSLSKNDCPIIVTIDDVDRLQEKELTAVLKLIRDTADFPNIFYIVAADNTHLEMMLTKNGIQHPDNYLKKFFNLDYILPAHEKVPTKAIKSMLEEILIAYGYQDNNIKSSLMRFQRLSNLDKIFVNMREVYRLLNAFTYSLDVLRKNDNIQLIDPYELFCLTIIRHLRTDIYKKLRDRNDEFLEVVNSGLDSCFHLKDDFNIEKIRKNKYILQHINDLNGQKTSQEKRKQQEEAEKLTLDDAVRLTEIKRDNIVTVILDYLFSNTENRNEQSICRCNVYFLYFSGEIESDKLTTAETIAILKMDQFNYERELNTLFDSKRSDAFISNFSYAYQQSRIGKENAMKKFYTLIKLKFAHRVDLDKRSFSTFEDYINKVEYESFMYFLFELYGRDINNNSKRIDKKEEGSLIEYCKTESDINMLTLAFFIFSQRLGNFIFGREIVNSMLELLANRLITERMTGYNPLSKTDESIFNTIILFRDEFSTREQWETKFEQFLCEDETRCKQWLSSIVTFYLNGTIEWNYRHHLAILGEYADSGDHLLDTVKQTFPSLTEIVDELKNFQHYRSLSDMTFTNSKYIQMAREIQHSKV